MPADDLKELIAWLKANPDKASLGHTGPGSPAHVAGILFQKQTGTRFQYVTYRSAGQAMQDMIAGHIDLMFIDPTIALEHVQPGSIKAYAVTAKNAYGRARHPDRGRSGIARILHSGWHAFWAPKGTPREVITNSMLRSSMPWPTRQCSALRTRLRVPRAQQTPEALRAFQKAEIERWWPILKEAGIKIKGE